jgi:hypothetical protein
MPLTPADLAFLTSPHGERLLAALADDDLSDANHLRLLTRLRRDYAPEQAGTALELARLRRDAVAKFGVDAARLFLTRDALEQASDPRIRRYRAAAWLRGGETLTDACCGIGADLLAFAAAGADVIGIEIDPLRAEMARLNTAALRLHARVITADVRDGVPQGDLIFYDPARRANGKRIYHVESYIPPLSLVRAWSAPCIKVKLSPGVDLAELADYGGDVEFISVDGDLKEALLHLPGGGARWATLINDDATLHYHDDGATVAVAEPAAWLCEPDPAIIRAGLVQSVAARCGGTLLDETIAYFTTPQPPTLAGVRAWRIEAWLPFNVKRIREALRERGVGSVTVKKRGTAVTPDAIIPQLKLRGDAARVLVLTRLRGAQIALICEGE